MLNVAISVDSATDYGPRAAQVVAAACEEVIGAHRCPVASALPPGAVAAWYAVVHPNDPALSSARVEFRDRTADGVLIEERTLTFESRDSQVSRLASVGTVIAALAAAREGSLTAVPPPRPAATFPAPAPGPGSVDLAALAATARGDGPSRVGGLARARWSFAGRPFALVTARYATRPGGIAGELGDHLDCSWWTLSAGAGARVGGRAPFGLDVTGELVAERTRVRATRGAESESGDVLGWGGRVGADVTWAASRAYAVVLGVDGTVVLPRLDVVVGTRDAVRVPTTTATLSLGVRWQP